MFRFDYLPTEREVSFRRRPGPFALEEAEFRQPAVLVLQVWDYDRVSANDFLGTWLLLASSLHLLCSYFPCLCLFFSVPGFPLYPSFSPVTSDPGLNHCFLPDLGVQGT